MIAVKLYTIILSKKVLTIIFYGFKVRDVKKTVKRFTKNKNSNLKGGKTMLESRYTTYNLIQFNFKASDKGIF